MMISRCEGADGAASLQLPYAACYVYSPSGTGAISVRSRRLLDRIKAPEPRWIARCGQGVCEQSRRAMPLEEFFQAADVLVPVPGRRAGAVRMSDAPFQLAEQLARRGLGRSIWPGLARIHEIPKTASSPPGARPTIAKQLESFGVVSDHRPAVEGLLLIDDVVSRGRTLLAAALRLQEAFPHARVRAFALIRTLGLRADVEHVLDPCVGHIRLRRGDASRVP
jgi:hypothetical protein